MGLTTPEKLGVTNLARVSNAYVFHHSCRLRDDLIMTSHLYDAGSGSYRYELQIGLYSDTYQTGIFTPGEYTQSNLTGAASNRPNGKVIPYDANRAIVLIKGYDSYSPSGYRTYAQIFSVDSTGTSINKGTLLDLGGGSKSDWNIFGFKLDDDKIIVITVDSQKSAWCRILSVSGTTLTLLSTTTLGSFYFYTPVNLLSQGNGRYMLLAACNGLSCLPLQIAADGTVTMDTITQLATSTAQNIMSDKMGNGNKVFCLYRMSESVNSETVYPLYTLVFDAGSSISVILNEIFDDKTVYTQKYGDTFVNYMNIAYVKALTENSILMIYSKTYNFNNSNAVYVAVVVNVTENGLCICSQNIIDDIPCSTSNNVYSFDLRPGVIAFGIGELSSSSKTSEIFCTIKENGLLSKSPKSRPLIAKQSGTGGDLIDVYIPS